MGDDLFTVAVTVAAWSLVWMAGLAWTVACFDRHGRYRWPRHLTAVRRWLHIDGAARGEPHRRAQHPGHRRAR